MMYKNYIGMYCGICVVASISTLALCIMRYFNFIHSWFWAFSPIWLSAGIVTISLVFAYSYVIIRDKFEKKNKRITKVLF